MQKAFGQVIIRLPLCSFSPVSLCPQLCHRQLIKLGSAPTEYIYNQNFKKKTKKNSPFSCKNLRSLKILGFLLINSNLVIPIISSLISLSLSVSYYFSKYDITRTRVTLHARGFEMISPDVAVIEREVCVIQPVCPV